MKAYVATKPYRPSNGTEGVMFMAEQCETCARDSEDGCPIHLASVANLPTEPEYPAEWVVDADDKMEVGPPFTARCTARIVPVPEGVKS